MKAIALALVAAVALPYAANAASFVNGSFEEGTDPGSFVTVNAGDSTSITGWTVTSGSVDYIGSYWNAENGARSIDLSGNGPGVLSQTFDTTAGQDYVVSFFLGANGDGPPPVKTVDVSATGNATQSYAVGTTPFPPNVVTYAPFNYAFTATDASTTLTFTSTVTTAYGAALDNVSLTPVPEAATWAMMIAGVGMAGFAMRRRQQVRVNFA